MRKEGRQDRLIPHIFTRRVITPFINQDIFDACGISGVKIPVRLVLYGEDGETKELLVAALRTEMSSQLCKMIKYYESRGDGFMRKYLRWVNIADSAMRYELDGWWWDPETELSISYVEDVYEMCEGIGEWGEKSFIKYCFEKICPLKTPFCSTFSFF